MARKAQQRHRPIKLCQCNHDRRQHYLGSHQCMAAMCPCDEYEAPEEQP